MHLTIDLTTGDSTLYCPTSLHADDHVLWCGMSIQVMKGRGEELETYRVKYGFTSVVYSTDLPIYLLNAKKIHGLEEFPSLTVDLAFARTAITEARVVKTAEEIELMRTAAKITTDAHIALMKAVGEPGATEQTLHALFEYVCFKRGFVFVANDRAPVQAYMPIVAFGRNGAVLHYV
jgi:Xaa-Pro dipeptidase